MNTARRPMYAWQDIPWHKVERAVFKLQQRIYRASRHGDVKTVHKLQRLLMKSWYAKLLATRRVTQDNRAHVMLGMTAITPGTPYRIACCPFCSLKTWGLKSPSGDSHPPQPAPTDMTYHISYYSINIKYYILCNLVIINTSLYLYGPRRVGHNPSRGT